MGTDEDLYCQLYGEAAPNFSHQERLKEADATPATPPLESQAEAAIHGPEIVTAEEPLEESVEAEAPQEGSVPATQQDDTSDEELDVHLDEQVPQEEEEDLDIKLDEDQHAQPPGASAAANRGPESVQKRTTAPSLSTEKAATAPKLQRQDAGASKAPISSTQRQQTSHPPAPDPDDPGVLPSQATHPGQRIRLPGQTRVTPDEYKEFLDLGHGDIFQLDIDSVVDAPWRVPGADPNDFFNYGMRAHSWKEYCKQVKQYQSEFMLQRKIQVYDKPDWSSAGDVDLPPELAAAVAKKRTREGE